MKTLALAAVAATMAAGTAFAHPINEPHVCGVDPDTVMEYPGYAGKQGVWYDRGDYFFGFETVRFLEPVEYKSWSKVEGITTHHRLYKDDCRTSEIEIVHTEGKDNVEGAGGAGGAGGSMYPMLSWDASTQTMRLSYGGVVASAVFDSSYDFATTDMNEVMSVANQAIVTAIDDEGLTQEQMTTAVEQFKDEWNNLEEAQVNSLFAEIQSDTGITINISAD